MEECEEVDRNKWFIAGDGLLEHHSLCKKPHSQDEWTDLYTYNETISNGKWEFKFRITTINSDKTGLVFGFIDASK